MAKNRAEWTAARKRQCWRKWCCDAWQPALRDNLLLVLIVIFFAGVFSWMFYGFVCMADCGMYPTKCYVDHISVEVKVCQGSLKDDDFSYYPYTGYVIWCFHAQTPTRSLSSLQLPPNSALVKKRNTRGDVFLCDTIKTSCTNDQTTAWKKANASSPVGTIRDCWYGFSSLETDYTSFYLQWREPWHLETWFGINKYYGIVAISIIGALAIFLIIREYILDRLEVHKYRDLTLYDENADASETEALVPVLGAR